MREKFYEIYQKVEEKVSFWVPIILMTGFVSSILFLIVEGILSVIVSVCWNVAMPTMFGFNKITILQAFIVTFTIACLRHNYVWSIKSDYREFKVEILNRSESEKRAKVLSVIFTVLWTLFSIFVTIWLVMHSWNRVIPELLNIELAQIDFAQAFSFAYLFNLLFRVPESHDKEAKEDNKNKKVLAETSNDIDITALED